MHKKTASFFAIGIILVAVGYFFPNRFVPTPQYTVSSEDTLAAAYQRKQSDVQVTGMGTVFRLLRDDLKGSRHQRFILQLDSGMTLLVAHNIDIAPRIDSLAKGDEVLFHGEYEWNERGGVLHWTHKDPRGRHPDGWLKHDGVLYQ